MNDITKIISANAAFKGEFPLEIRNVLKKLCSAAGVSGDENTAADIALEFLKEHIPNAQKDKFNNVYGTSIKDEKLPMLLLDAHIDEIGMVVTFIDDKGFIRIGTCGGHDFRILPAQSVTIWGVEPVKGIVCSIPPHLSKDDKKTVKNDDIVIDTGYNKEKLLEKISLGDRITLDSVFSDLQNCRVASRALDDRAGVTAILYALYLLKGKEIEYNLSVLFSSQEEVGSRGAMIAAHRLRPDFAVAVDVSYGDFPGLPAYDCGKLGDGTMIGISPCLDREMFEDLKNIARKNKVKHQIEVMGRSTGTNADNITVSRGGVRGALLSIPIRNMHTPVEVAEITDIEATGRLIADFCRGGG
ncbi:MAG: M20/M25/M40 family metallo-hydrolase [Eubacterium sp.]|jgi:endoglucanase|nr:M20/M25/M40 family metallo-hydrolase [Eubacterium sp.]